MILKSFYSFFHLLLDHRDIVLFPPCNISASINSALVCYNNDNDGDGNNEIIIMIKYI